MRPGSRLGWLLRMLPRRLLAALDGWSARVALERAERRRLASCPASGSGA